jgi:hypothetical protein
MLHVYVHTHTHTHRQSFCGLYDCLFQILLIHRQRILHANLHTSIHIHFGRIRPVNLLIRLAYIRVYRYAYIHVQFRGFRIRRPLQVVGHSHNVSATGMYVYIHVYMYICSYTNQHMSFMRVPLPLSSKVLLTSTRR